jgi:molybdopterin-containing oxidoreductase family membrane subunit
MWFERFIIIVGGLHRDFLTSSWGMFYPTWVDIWTFVGTFGIFLSLFLLFIRFLPMIAMSEVKIVCRKLIRITPRPKNITRRRRRKERI